MKVYFDNDGSYGQSAVRIPVIVNDKPIGFVLEVDQERVTCYLWDQYIKREQFVMQMCGEQNIRAIRIDNY